MIVRSLTLRVSVVPLLCRNDLNQQAVTLRHLPLAVVHQERTPAGAGVLYLFITQRVA
jgi:hypothetical protein